MSEYKEERQQKVKNLFFKALHVVCYVLSVLFVVLMVVVGCQSCDVRHKNEQSSITNNVNNALHVKQSLPQRNLFPYDYGEYDYVLTPKYNSSSFTLNLDIIRELNTLVGLPNTYVSSSDEGVSRRFYIDLDGYILYGGYWSTLEDVYVLFTSMEIDNGDFYWRLNGIIYDRDGISSNGGYFLKHDNNGENFVYDVIGGSLIISYDRLTENQAVLLSYFYDFKKISELDSFTFNKIFNFNAPNKSSLSMAFMESTNWWTLWVTDNVDGNYIDMRLDTGYFISANQLYDSIIWRFRIDRNDDNITLDDLGDGNYYDIPTGDFIYVSMFYKNTETGLINLVNQRDEVSGKSDLFNLPYIAYKTSTTWVNDDYRKLVFLSSLNEELTATINAFNNNNQTSISGYVVNGEVINVFTLVGLAFAGLLPILNTMLLPGITIGMLMFVPLVAMLVFAIIRIIKK